MKKGIKQRRKQIGIYTKMRLNIGEYLDKKVTKNLATETVFETFIFTFLNNKKIENLKNKNSELLSFLFTYVAFNF